jgi:hypothetical protein
MTARRLERPLHAATHLAHVLANATPAGLGVWIRETVGQQRGQRNDATRSLFGLILTISLEKNEMPGL